MRLAVLLLAGVTLWAQQAPDLADILSQSALVAKDNEAKARLYAFREHTVNIQVDKNGKETDRQTETWDVIGLEGSAYRRLLERDDKPLPPKDQRREDDRMAKEADKRRKETAEQRRNRTLSLSYNLTFSPDQMHLYDASYLGEDTMGGRPVYVVQGMPKAVKPADDNEKELLHYRVKRWIDKEDLQDARIELEVISEGSRMRPGTVFDVRTFRTSDGVWLEEVARIRYDVKFFKLLGVHGEQTTTRSNFQKFEVNSRVVEDTQ